MGNVETGDDIFVDNYMDWTKKKRPHISSDFLPVQEVNLTRFRSKPRRTRYRNKTEYDNDEWLIDDGAAMIYGTPAKPGKPREMRRLPYGPSPRPALHSIDEHCRNKGLRHVHAAIDVLRLNRHDLCGVPTGVAEMFASDMSHALNGIFLNPYDHARSAQQKRILPEKGQSVR